MKTLPLLLAIALCSNGWAAEPALSAIKFGPPSIQGVRDVSPHHSGAEKTVFISTKNIQNVTINWGDGISETFDRTVIAYCSILSDPRYAYFTLNHKYGSGQAYAVTITASGIRKDADGRSLDTGDRKFSFRKK